MTLFNWPVQYCNRSSIALPLNWSWPIDGIFHNLNFWDVQICLGNNERKIYFQSVNNIETYGMSNVNHLLIILDNRPCWSASNHNSISSIFNVHVGCNVTATLINASHFECWARCLIHNYPQRYFKTCQCWCDRPQWRRRRVWRWIW